MAFPGTRTALNLPDLRADEIPRGSVLTTIDSAESGRAIDAMVERSARGFLPLRSLKNAPVVQVHYGSARFPARILYCSIAVSCSRGKRRSHDSVSRNRCSFLPGIVSSSVIPRVGRRSQAVSS